MNPWLKRLIERFFRRNPEHPVEAMPRFNTPTLVAENGKVLENVETPVYLNEVIDGVWYATSVRKGTQWLPLDPPLRLPVAKVPPSIKRKHP